MTKEIFSKCGMGEVYEHIIKEYLGGDPMDFTTDGKGSCSVCKKIMKKGTVHCGNVAYGYLEVSDIGYPHSMCLYDIGDLMGGEKKGMKCIMGVRLDKVCGWGCKEIREKEIYDEIKNTGKLPVGKYEEDRFREPCGYQSCDHITIDYNTCHYCLVIDGELGSTPMRNGTYAKYISEERLMMVLKLRDTECVLIKMENGQHITRDLRYIK